MVLQLSTSPFVSPKPTVAASGSGTHSTTSASSFMRFSLSSAAASAAAATASATASSAKANRKRRQKQHRQTQEDHLDNDDTRYKLGQVYNPHDQASIQPFSWTRGLFRLISLSSITFTIFCLTKLKTQGLQDGFGRGSQ
ncbi:hypothetical protein BGZ94_003930, partial [Podila epigama]